MDDLTRDAIGFALMVGLIWFGLIYAGPLLATLINGG